MRGPGPLTVALLVALAAAAGCSEYNFKPDEEPVPQPVPGEPIADAGEDIETIPLTDVRLDGTASYDPENLQIVAWEWTLVRAPEDSNSVLSDHTDDRPVFFVDVPGLYEFDLTVQNSRGQWDSSPDRVVIDAEPGASVYVQITWDAEVDLDLHVLNGSSSPLFEIPGDACYCNSNPDWGAAGVAADDPSLDWDERNGFGPETTTILAPAAGRYPVKVHYYGQFGASFCEDIPCPVTTATARIFVDGEEVATAVGTLSNQGDIWHAGAVEWPSGTFIPDGHMGRTTEISCF